MRNPLSFTLGVLVPGALVVVLLVWEFSPLFLVVLAGLEGLAIVTDDEFKEWRNERKAKKDAQP